MRPGQENFVSMQKGLSSCCYAALLVSKDFLNSEHCVKEANTILLRESLEEKRILLPFFYFNSHLDDQFEMIKNRSALIRNDESADGFALKMASHILITLGREDPGPEKLRQALQHYLQSLVTLEPESRMEPEGLLPQQPTLTTGNNESNENLFMLKYGVTLGWALARYDIVDGSELDFARQAQPGIENLIRDQLNAGGDEDLADFTGCQDIVVRLLNRYQVVNHYCLAGLLIGLCNARIVIGLPELAESAMTDVPVEVVQNKVELFTTLVNQKPRTIADLYGVLLRFVAFG